MTDHVPPEEAEVAFSGQYRDLRPLGTQGAQGTVYRAVARDGVDVALKLYHADQVEERSTREVAALGRLTGETVAKLHGAGAVTLRGEDYRYIATTFIDGRPLSDVISLGPLPPADAAAIGADIALAIDEIWALNIVHRDVKPPNIMVRADGRGILIDLGIARHLDLNTLTGPGIAWGTMGYFAPESLRGRKPTCKADVFALGIVIQETLLGRHPTRRNQALLENGGPNISRHKPDTPAALAEIIDRMVDGRPHLRPLPRVAAEDLAAVATQLRGGR